MSDAYYRFTLCSSIPVFFQLNCSQSNCLASHRRSTFLFSGVSEYIYAFCWNIVENCRKRSRYFSRCCWKISRTFTPLSKDSNTSSCFDRRSALFARTCKRGPLSSCYPCGKLPRRHRFRRPELKGFAWNYSTDRYGIVSDNGGSSTRYSKKIFDNLALVIFVGRHRGGDIWARVRISVHCLPLSRGQSFTGSYIQPWSERRGWIS